MSRLIVVDTCAILSYFCDIVGSDKSIGSKGEKILEIGFSGSSEINIIIPNMSLIEIYEKWCTTDEATAKIKYEIVEYLSQLNNVEFRELDEEVMTKAFTLTRTKVNLELHDRIIYATAIILDAPLVTSDTKILKYNKVSKLVKIINN